VVPEELVVQFKVVKVGSVAEVAPGPVAGEEGVVVVAAGILEEGVEEGPLAQGGTAAVAART
jgi:hypothetical protein